MFVSDGKDKTILTQGIFSSEFPVHTFGLQNITSYHPAKDRINCALRVMKYIADMTSGTYSFIDEDTNSIKEAFELFITGITLVAATSVNITLAAHEGVAISSIESGGHDNEVSSDKGSGEIHIDNMYAGERKNFIVYLRVFEGIKKLVTIGGRYVGFNVGKQLGDMDVFVLRPHRGCSPGKLGIHPDVAAELVRIWLEKALSATVELKYNWQRYSDQFTQLQAEWQELWNKVKYSDEGHAAPEETLLELGKDVAEIKRHIVCIRSFTQPKDVPYLLSWLSCHKWQRATTKGSRSNSGAFSLAQAQEAPPPLQAPPPQHVDSDKDVIFPPPPRHVDIDEDIIF